MSVFENYKNCPVCENTDEWIHNDKSMCGPCRLRAKCAWQAEMIERAKLLLSDPENCLYLDNEKWLSDLEKGPH